jgi:YHS domain-containing protein
MPSKTEDLVEDPCCHTYLPLSQAYKADIDGKTVYFCSETCYENFRKNKS